MPETNIAEQILRENNDFTDAHPLVDIKGLSSPKVCNFLNQLVAHMDPGENYLEIGCFQGLTLMSAAYKNRGKTCIACDKIRFWGRHTGFGFMVKRALYGNMKRYGDQAATIVFHHMKSQRLFKKQLVPSPVGVYFYDGDHSYSATKQHVVVAAPLLSEKSVLLMDDWNDPAIQRGTYDGFRQAGLEVLWERELAGENFNTSGWWNGLAVFYLQRKQAN